MTDSVLFNRNKVYTKNEIGEKLHETEDWSHPMQKLNLRTWLSVWIMVTFTLMQVTYAKVLKIETYATWQRVDQFEQATGQPNRWASENPAKEGLAACQAAVWCMLRSLFPDEKSKSSVYLGLLSCQLETCKQPEMQLMLSGIPGYDVPLRGNYFVSDESHYSRHFPLNHSNANTES